MTRFKLRSNCGQCDEGFFEWFPSPPLNATCSVCNTEYTQKDLLRLWQSDYTNHHKEVAATLQFSPADLYFYRAKIIRIIDGDTFEAELDLGFRIKVTEKFRLLGFDTPEPTWRAENSAELAHGHLASQMASDLLLDREVILTTRKTGKYGRWLADVVLGGNLSNPYMLTDLFLQQGMHKLDSYEGM